MTETNVDKFSLLTTTSVIARSTSIEGQITTNQDLIIHGQVKGSLYLPESALIIEKTAQVNANVEARLVIIRGKFQGEIIAREKVRIETGGQMEGKIESPCLAIEEKAQFKGRIKMSEKKNTG
ncbi:MAG: hypothetical protein DRJ06_02155 [Candidatus Aminicenantes bacterium]|nr:MAG: hypothetical protein DRJ06_02155 [Candidatus Aminicenantes bacterium]